MGSQVNFFMGSKDEQAFCQFATLNIGLTLLRRRHRTAPHVRASIPLSDASEPLNAWYVLWDEASADKRQITPQHKVPGSSGVYDVNPQIFPVIEFRRCVLTEGGLQPGRIWVTFDHESLDADQRRRLKATFRKLKSWIDKWPHRLNAYRVGPHAAEFFDRGGKSLVSGLGEISRIEPATEKCGDE